MEAYLASGFSFERLADLLQSADILTGIRMGQHPNGWPHDHGTGFRINSGKLDMCFEKAGEGAVNVDQYEVVAEVGKMVDAKADFHRALYEVLQTEDRDKLIEIVIENAAYDIQLMGRMYHVLGLDPTAPLSDMTTEALKEKLFRIAGLSNR